MPTIPCFDSQGQIAGTIAGCVVGKANLVGAALGQATSKDDLILPFSLLIVVNVVRSEAICGVGRLGPVADQFCIIVIVDDSRERDIAKRHFSAGFFHEALLHRQAHREFEALHFFPENLTSLACNRQWALDPASDVYAAIARAGDDFGGTENPGDSVVVLLRHRIKFVVMAARAAERESEKGTSHRIDLLVGRIEPEFLLVAFGEHLWTEREKGCSDQLIRSLLIRLPRQKVTGDLRPDKIVVGKITIECIDNPISITPRLIEGKVAIPTV